MPLRIPRTSKNGADALQQVIKFAADETARTNADVTVTMTAFFQGIAAQVAQGKIVRIPGFGAWFPFVYEREERTGLPDLVQPRFQASLCFRSEVRDYCPPGMVEGGNQKYHNYAHNHREWRDRAGDSRATKSLAEWRDELRAAARRRGQDL